MSRPPTPPTPAGRSPAAAGAGGGPMPPSPDPRPLPPPLEVLAHPNEGMHDVKVAHANQLAAARVEEDEPSEREELERTAEAGARPPRRLGPSPSPARVARVEVHEPVALPECPPSDHDPLGLVQSPD